LVVAVMALALTATACAGPSVLVIGESVRTPEPPQPMLHIMLTAADDLTPLSGEVTFGAATVEADADGMAVHVWDEEPVLVSVAAPGFLPMSAMIETLPEKGPVEFRMEPVVLTGTVLSESGAALPDAIVRLDGGLPVRTDGNGVFTISRATAGELSVARPAFDDTAFEWDGEDATIQIEMAPRIIYALRVGGPVAGTPGDWADVLELADNTGVNALVVDTKNEGGTVMWDVDVSTAHQIGAVRVFYDVDQVLADMDAHGLYKITRVVTFQDTPMARSRPEIALMNEETGEPWRTYGGEAWLDATDDESWEYPIALGVEACRRGFDEIQFDYVRFPSDGPLAVADFDGEYTRENRVATIAAFLTEARRQINAEGCAVAADIFAAVLESSGDEGIGQMPGPLSNAVDVLSPMVYPSHYADGWRGFDDPTDHPSEVVGGALSTGLTKLEGFAIYRPWLETYPQPVEGILAERAEAEERGLGWMLWSANTVFSEAFLPPAAE
jgi:hypothetical protein